MLVRKIAAIAATTFLLSCNLSFGQTSKNAAAPANASFIGLWGTEQTFGPLVRGELTIDGRHRQWQAAIAGFQVLVQHTASGVTFSLPGGAGEFRGRMDSSFRTIDGDWVQPAGVVNNNQYATPVHLTLLGPSVWRGEVIPLDDHISFYVSIRARASGALSAVIINPEYNIFRRRIYDVAVHGSDVTFSNSRRPDDHFSGTYDKTADRLSLPLLQSFPPFILSRRNQGDAIGFYARTPAVSGYLYRKPVPARDGWPVASLADVGMSEAPIALLVNDILTADPADNPVDIDSLLIARHGKLVLEEYFHGYDAERPHDMRSASKTFAPVLVGIANQLKFGLGPGTPVYPLFQQYKPFAHWDKPKECPDGKRPDDHDLRLCLRR